jgi:hypothetical protein
MEAKLSTNERTDRVLYVFEVTTTKEEREKLKLET